MGTGLSKDAFKLKQEQEEDTKMKPKMEKKRYGEEIALKHAITIHETAYPTTIPSLLRASSNGHAEGELASLINASNQNPTTEGRIIGLLQEGEKRKLHWSAKITFN